MHADNRAVREIRSVRIFPDSEVCGTKTMPPELVRPGKGGGGVRIAPTLRKLGGEGKSEERSEKQSEHRSQTCSIFGGFLREAWSRLVVWFLPVVLCPDTGVVGASF